MVTYNPFTGRTIQLVPNVYQKHELFIEKDRNLFGYNLFITRYWSVFSLYRPSRLERFVPHIVAGVMNATLHLSEPSIKDQIDSQEVANSDLIVNGRQYLASKYEELQIEPTIALKHGGICVLVPFERFRTMFESVYKTLNPLVWIFTIVAVFSVYSSLIIIFQMERRSSRSEPIRFRLHLFGKCMTFSRDIAPRLISSNWLLHYVIITSVFQSALYDGVTLKGRGAKITNLKDLINSEYQILINEAFYHAYPDFINNSSLKDNCERVSVHEYLRKLYTKNTNYAYMEELKRTNHLANDVVDENNLAVFYTMRPCISPEIETYYVRVGSPFLNRMNWILRQLQENGLIKFWAERLHHPVASSQKLFHRSDSGHLKNLHFIFEYWFYAVLLCLAVFFVELILVFCCKKEV